MSKPYTATQKRIAKFFGGEQSIKVGGFFDLKEILALVIVSASTMSFRHASPIETFGNDKPALAETMIKA